MGRLLSPGPRLVRRVLGLIAAGVPLVAMSSLMLGIGPLANTEPASAEAPGGEKLAALSSIPVPAPSDLTPYIADQDAVVRLGKALFWDMQVGSDGVQACASCHFAAGADARSINQLDPALRSPSGGAFSPGHAPNQELSADDFPFHKLENANDRFSQLIADSPDVVSSQGVFNVPFSGVEVGNAVEPGENAGDSRFEQDHLSTRRVPGRNAPSAINAVFNDRQFWDGRAQATFNGVNPFGDRDADARVLRATPSGLEPFRVAIQQASLASQAVGPPGSDFEMSHSGRAFRDIGKKLLSLVPLSRQRVEPGDSILGPYAAAGGSQAGLTTTYDEMLRAAFKPEWWNSNKIVRVLPDGSTSIVDRPDRPLAGDEYELGAYNFSLFFGLAVMEYERTLVSDDTPVDRFLAGDTSALTPLQQQGLAIFAGEKGSCAGCHGGAEMTAASVAAGTTEPIEVMAMGNGGIASYDGGFYNIGQRPTEEDLGVGGTDPWGIALSYSRSLGATGRIAVDGTFKSPQLRNVALTAPYFHNGSAATLRQVVEFYNRGGDFHEANMANLDSDIEALGLTEQEVDALVAFMEALTDPRVEQQCGPFDHPELFLPNGHRAANGALGTVDRGDGAAVDAFLRLPQTGPDCSTNPSTPRFLAFTGPDVTPPSPLAVQPDTVLTSTTRDGVRAPKFAFRGVQSRVTSDKMWFECRLDQGAWGPCGGATKSVKVGEGPHLFSVRAVARNGARDATPAKTAWWVPYTTRAEYTGATVLPSKQKVLLAADVRGPHGCNDARLVRFSLVTASGTLALGTTRSDAHGRAVLATRLHAASGRYTVRVKVLGSRSCAAVTREARVSVRRAMSSLRGSGAAQGLTFTVKANSRGVGTLKLSAPRALKVDGRVDAAVKVGGEGVVTGTARVRYWDARQGRFEKRLHTLRFTFAFRAGRHGAIKLVLPASGRTPTAASWMPVRSGGIPRLARDARSR